MLVNVFYGLIDPPKEKKDNTTNDAFMTGDNSDLRASSYKYYEFFTLRKISNKAFSYPSQEIDHDFYIGSFVHESIAGLLDNINLVYKVISNGLEETFDVVFNSDYYKNNPLYISSLDIYRINQSNKSSLDIIIQDLHEKINKIRKTPVTDHYKDIQKRLYTFRSGQLADYDYILVLKLTKYNTEDNRKIDDLELYQTYFVNQILLNDYLKTLEVELLAKKEKVVENLLAIQKSAYIKIDSLTKASYGLSYFSKSINKR